RRDADAPRRRHDDPSRRDALRRLVRRPQRSDAARLRTPRLRAPDDAARLPPRRRCSGHVTRTRRIVPRRPSRFVAATVAVLLGGLLAADAFARAGGGGNW